MTRRASHPRTGPSGITLTEILISIMIMAIGLVSLATLFPIGLLRLREAQRSSRAAILSESTNADMLGRGLLERTTFIDPTVSPWYSSLNVPKSYDPWIQDTPVAFDDWSGGGTPANAGAYRGYGGMGAYDINQVNLNGLAPNYAPGLPVAYDPLWWYQQGAQPFSGIGATAEIQSRFGSGVGLGLSTGAHGLQRLTNLWAFNADGSVKSVYAANMIISAFVSPEDVLWQDAKGTSYVNYASAISLTSPSPVIPDLSIAAIGNGGGLGGLSPDGARTNDWRYTWMFTGQRADAFNDKVYTGNIVIFENRPFGFQTLVNQSNGNSITQVAGERTLQAIFGYGKNVQAAGTMVSDGTQVGYAIGSDNAVLLLWPKGYPDPEIRPGGWIADVTYERVESTGQANFLIQPDVTTKAGSPPAQRCFWYQVRRASPPADSADFAGMRYTVIQTTQKLQAKTLLTAAGVPVHNNVALASPHVIAVIPKTFAIP